MLLSIFVSILQIGILKYLDILIIHVYVGLDKSGACYVVFPSCPLIDFPNVNYFWVPILFNCIINKISLVAFINLNFLILFNLGVCYDHFWSNDCPAIKHSIIWDAYIPYFWSNYLSLFDCFVHFTILNESK